LKAQLDCGKSYNAASATALAKIFDELYPNSHTIAPLFNDPNNILCIEYISAIYKYCANIQPLIIQRIGSQYNDTTINGVYASATAIRAADLSTMQRYIPFKYDKICEQRRTHAADMKLFNKLALYALKRANIDEIKNLRDCSEGMEYLLKNVSHLSNINDITEAVIGKRYSKKRINRLYLDLLLGIDKTLTCKPFITRLLACSKKFDFSILPEFVKTNNAEIKKSIENSDIFSVSSADFNAISLYNTLSDIIGDYYNYSLVKI
ncbi:MAG: nucleotidyltransferase family protein, partial [Clostridiales bacterium]|nr:nucleotidyltransferase family protein [Clostridiales bacterium]